MIATQNQLPDSQRIVITGIGLTAPNGNSYREFRESLLAGKSGVTNYEIRYIGQTLAGICDFDATRHQKRRDIRRGTRAGSIGIYCAAEAIEDSGLDWPNVDPTRVGVYIGVTEHGNVETENEVHELKGFDYDTSCWSHHHNPRTVANNPAGEICLNRGITGPHYTIGAACAAGNAGLIQAAQMLRLGECDIALHPREMRAWRRHHGAEHRPEIEVEGDGALDIGDLHLPSGATRSADRPCRPGPAPPPSM
jgi:3-oxoacyl-[acyl-carrier-protein] synthase II